MTRDGNIEQRISELIGPAAPEPASDDAVRLNEQIAADPALRDLRDGYTRLDAALRRWRTLPAGAASREWSGLLRQKIEDDVARLMSEYEEGTLSADEARQVARRFATDAAASRASREIQRTNELVEAWAGPMPPVDWKATHARFSGAVRAEAARIRRRRIVGWAGGMALAACIGLAAVVGWRIMQTSAPPKPNEPLKMVHVVIDGPGGTAKSIAKYDESTPPGYKPLTVTPPSRSAALQPTRPRPTPTGNDNIPN